MKTLKENIVESVGRRKAEVFVRSDFDAFGSYDQVGRALRQLVQEGALVRIGYGLYAKATRSPLTGDRPVPRVGIRRLGEESLRKLKIEVEASRAERAYTADRTTQVPSGRVIAVKKRVRRKIGYNGAYIGFERTHA